VAGYGSSEDSWIIDPEALLVFTCSLGRYEARLFDEVIDWLDTNGSFINIQRLRTIMKQEQFSGQKVISAIAAIMTERGKLLKWKKLAQQKGETTAVEDLFFQKNGQPMKLFGTPDDTFKKYGFSRGKIRYRGHTQPVSTFQNTGFLFKLRALLGVNARCEILIYLLTHESGHPRHIARETYFYQKTVQDILVEMARSGLVYVRTAGREKHYWLKKEDWLKLLLHEEQPPRWVNWPPLLNALEQIWLKLKDKTLLGLDPLAQSSELRGLMHKVRPWIERAGFTKVLSDDKSYLGKDYIAVFISDVKKLLAELNCKNTNT
jgi:hypothetical protein